MNKNPCSVPTLSHSNVSDSCGRDKVDLLNSFFSSCFNTIHPPLLPTDLNFVQPDECPNDLLCTVDEVEQLLSNLDKSKASGPDGVSATMLRNTASSIAPIVTKIFNLSIQSGQSLRNGNNH